MDTAFETMVTPQEIQNDVADNGEIGCTLPLTRSMMVFTKGDIQHPMQAILNTPMAANVIQMSLGILSQARDEETLLHFRFVAEATLRTDDHGGA